MWPHLLHTQLVVGMMVLLAAVSAQLVEKTKEKDPDHRVVFSWAYRTPYSLPSYTGQSSSSSSKDGDLQYTHMPMLALLPNGSVAAAWQGSIVFWEGSRFQSIFWSLSNDNATSWGAKRMIMTSSKDMPLWGPVLHVQGNVVYLFYAESRPQCVWGGEGPSYSPGGDVHMAESYDNGETWINDKVIYAFEDTAEIPKVVANQLVVTSTGSWVLPVWHEKAGGSCEAAPDMHGVPGVLISDDQGATWKAVVIEKSEVAKKSNTWLIENTIALNEEEGPDVLLTMFRTSDVGVLYASSSIDGGTSWLPPYPTPLPNNNSKVNLISILSMLVLALNNVADRNFRSPLHLLTSEDGGATWDLPLVIEDEPIAHFAYPTLLFNPLEETVLVAYQVQYPPSVGRKRSLLSTDGQQGFLMENVTYVDGDGSTRYSATDGQQRFLAEDATPVDGDGSTRYSVRAWGKTCWGIKVAEVSLSDLMDNARAIDGMLG